MGGEIRAASITFFNTTYSLVLSVNLFPLKLALPFGGVE